MVMIFKSEKARNFLIEYGEVFTFRLKKRKKVGFDWINEGYGKSKLFNVYIDFCGVVHHLDLKSYVNLSGFETIEDWWEEIRELNKGYLPVEGFLYHVETA